DCRREASSALSGSPDIWHIHNHSLGKNGIQPQLVQRLAEAAERVLLQPHDFAEDGRPANYSLLREFLGDELDSALYPFSGRVQYAVLNQRDRSFLRAAGVAREFVHLLPNAVPEVRPLDEPMGHPWSRLFIYPCRGIRRKNIGEFLLWSALAEEGDRFAMTLAPKNPLAKPVYDEWVAFAGKLHLPVSFNIAVEWENDFEENVARADALVTTSVAEGFGLAFMEPWLFGKPLCGRNLPEITGDFAANGIDLSNLYQSLRVPLSLLDRRELEQTVRSEMEAAYEQYSRSLTDADFCVAMNVLVQDDMVEFGALNEAMQQRVILQADQLDGLSLVDALPGRERIDKNRAAVLAHYGLDAYGERLFGFYNSLMQAEDASIEYAPASRLLDQFLKPERFNLLRT
ncbi:hypothetical protein ACFLQY_05680, partial [Verrucomicrobiota bacterium]